MNRTLRNHVLAAASALALTACGGLIGLPEPVELETAFGFGGGIAVDLTAATPSAVAAAQAGATYEGSIDETFAVDAADIPSILQGLVRIDGVSETLSLDTSLTVATAAASDFPASFTASGATLSDLTIIRTGATILGPLSFTGFASASMTFAAVGPCDGVTACTYAAATQVDLLEIGLSAAAANAYAKTIIAGGTFRVQADVALDVDPALPTGATISAIVVGTGAVIE
jgi:hypothetical protein